MAANLAPIGNGVTFFTQGVVLAGGKINTYLSGTTTPAATYTDSTQAVQNANPIILGSNGMAPNEIWLPSGVKYKFVLTDANNNVLGTFDNLVGINDASSPMSEWISVGATPTYVSATNFTVPGDQTGTFTQGRRVRAFVTSGTVYGTVTSATFSSSNTTVVLTMDSTSLDNGLSSVNVGFLSSQNQSVPANLQNIVSVNGGPFSGLRNAFINPEMAIDQRNNGAAQTFTAGAALAYCVDRWYGYCTGANVTGQRVAGSGNSQYRYQFTGAASVTGIGFGQRIETANSIRYAGATATLAVDLANSLLTTVTWTTYYANTTDTFGSLASPTRTQIATGTFTVNSTVSRYYAQIAIPAAATTGIEIVFTVGAQTSGTWTIGRAALLPSGTNETYMEPRPLGLELMLCQRYFEVIGDYTNNFPNIAGYTSAGSAYAVPIPFAVDKRAVPTLTKNGTWTLTNCAQPVVLNPSVRGFTLSATATVTSALQFAAAASGCNVTASAEL